MSICMCGVCDMYGVVHDVWCVCGRRKKCCMGVCFSSMLVELQLDSSALVLQGLQGTGLDS